MALRLPATQTLIMPRKSRPPPRPPIVDFLLRFGTHAFYIGTLGFPGLGLAPPTPDWGSTQGRAHCMVLNIWPVLTATISSSRWWWV
jgi:ABC-type dipeptide/oligopeptide/nickel transport system permease subunit